MLILASPIVTALMPSLEANEGNNITLSFEISNANPVVMSNSIIWSFTPATGSAIEINSSPHYIFSFDRLNLTIVGVTVGDQGSYSMRATNPAGSFSASVSLTVYGKHVSFTLKTAQCFFFAVGAYIEQVGTTNLTVNVGETVSLECRADGLPIPFVVWLKNDRLVLNSQDKIQIQTNRTSRGLRTILNDSVSSVLTIMNLSPSDSGVYKCRAANTFNITELSYSLTVLSGPPPDFCTPNPCRNKAQCISGDFSFVCECRTGFIGTACDTGELSLSTML